MEFLVSDKFKSNSKRTQHKCRRNVDQQRVIKFEFISHKGVSASSTRLQYFNSHSKHFEFSTSIVIFKYLVPQLIEICIASAIFDIAEKQ